MESSLAFGVVLLVGVLGLLTTRTQRTLGLLAGPSTAGAAIDSTSRVLDSVMSSRDSNEVTPVSIPDSLPAGPGGIAGGVPGGVIGGVTKAGAPDSPPVTLSTVPPRYPDLARQAKVSGMVIVEVQIDSTGKVTDATVLRGHPLLGSAAVEAIKQWRYRPAVRDGRPVAARKTESVNFAL